MDRAVIVLLTVCCLLQWPLATTGRQPGTKHHFFYAVEMDGGTRAAQALAEQHGLQFISQVSAYLKPAFITSSYGPAIFIL